LPSCSARLWYRRNLELRYRPASFRYVRHDALSQQRTDRPSSHGRQVRLFPAGRRSTGGIDIEYGTLLWLVKAKPITQPALGESLLFIVETE